MKKIYLLIAIILVLGACNTPPKPEPFEPDLKSPSIKISDIEMQVHKTFPLTGLSKVNVEVSYFPIEDAVCLRWRHGMMSFYQFWSYDGREEFINALAKYKEDYEARAFGKNSRKNRRQYGTSEGYIIWQASSFTIRARAANIVDFGYQFSEGAPYFSATQRETTYVDKNSRGLDRSLNAMPAYFTRAQADALAAIFDPDFIASLSLANQAVRNIDVDFEDYDSEDAPEAIQEEIQEDNIEYIINDE